MSLNMPARRIAISASSSLQLPLRPSPALRLLSSPITNQIRSKWNLRDLNPFRIREDPVAPTSPEHLNDPKVRSNMMAQVNKPRLTSSIFEDEIAPEKSASGADAPETPETVVSPSDMALVLDPDPSSRERWERKMLIRMVERRGRGAPETRREIIARSERHMRHKSEWLPTSTKKLVHLARQISGKPVDDALLQMEYSKKKMAAEVKYILEEARDKAIVVHGMGLGKVNAGAEVSDSSKEVEIKTKDGKWMKVSDPTRLYVSEAWVGRGTPRARRIAYLGRGRKGIMKSPRASLSVVLKEEKTRVREHHERSQKAERAGPWVHLPSRPVSAQRQYYSW